MLRPELAGSCLYLRNGGRIKPRELVLEALRDSLLTCRIHTVREDVRTFAASRSP